MFLSTIDVTIVGRPGDQVCMLVSLTRLGPTRHGIDKSFAVLGVEPNAMARAFSTVRQMRVTPVAGAPGLFTVNTPLSWLGTRTARDEAYAAFADVFRRLAEVARTAGGVLVPPALGTTRHPAVFGGDTHTIEVLSPVEQEVVCNLLRTEVSTLIALFGRGATVAGASRDRVGSRWLAASRSHLATRFLASTAGEHLDRVKADLRRRDGVALLDRMDVHPGREPDGTLTVVVRCLDGAATLAGSRAQTLLLAALVMRARRMVRDGRRTGNVQQRVLEDNRARAVADGLRARLVVEDARTTRRSPGGAANQAEPRTRTARDAARALVQAVSVELRNMDAAAEELAPVLLALDLPDLGVNRNATETDLLTRWASGGEHEMFGKSTASLTDHTPGGPLLAWLNQFAPSQTSIVLGSWRTRIAEARSGSPHRRNAPRTTGGKPTRDRGGDGRHGNGGKGGA